jgi:hypothetical protein
MTVRKQQFMFIVDEIAVTFRDPAKRPSFLDLSAHGPRFIGHSPAIARSLRSLHPQEITPDTHSESCELLEVEVAMHTSTKPRSKDTLSIPENEVCFWVHP